MRNRENRFRKNWLGTDVRQKFVDKWVVDFSAIDRGSLSPAEFCHALIRQCWWDLFGNRARNGQRVSRHPQFRGRYRSLPDSVLEVLERWHFGEVDLRLLDHVPTAAEVLANQADGARCVSALITRDQILNFEEHGRDFLSFLIHDLVHAHHFFQDRLEYQRQVKFARRMKAIFRSQIFAGTPFEPEFDYLVSDMNSHVVHLLKTLKSLSDRLDHAGLKKTLADEIPLWDSLNSSSESSHTHRELLKAWDQLP